MAIFFYIFASLIVISAIGVIGSRNTVYSVLWLIFAFCNAAGLVLLLGAEFLAMMLIVIYVGAVAVLFLFVIMMLDVNLAEIKKHLASNLALSSLISLVMLLDLCLIIFLGFKDITLIIPNDYSTPNPNITPNTHAVGEILYTDFILPFQIAGVILFTAMIACIALTLRHRKGMKKQDVTWQQAQCKQTNLKIAQVNKGTGIEEIKYE